MARFEEAAPRVVVFSSDSPAGPLDNDPAQITELVDDLSSAGVEFEVLRAEADVASQVIDLADEQSAELIVISTRRRSAVMKPAAVRASSASSSRRPARWSSSSRGAVGSQTLNSKVFLVLSN